MSSANQFRIAAIVIAVLMTVYALGSLLSLTFSPSQPDLPADPTKIATQDISRFARWTTLVSPFRTDLEANYATAVALEALRPGKILLSAADLQQNQHAEKVVQRVLRGAPTNSTLWLMVALLQTQRGSESPQTVEALKMSYFTAPTYAQLMPLRLYTVALSYTLSDPDLKQLALGDVRLMLLRKPDMKAKVLLAYRNGSGPGRAFLENAAQSIDPEFASELRKGA